MLQLITDTALHFQPWNLCSQKLVSISVSYFIVLQKSTIPKTKYTYWQK